MINVTSAFSGLLSPLIIKRLSAGSYVDHEWVDGSVTDIKIGAVVQIANPDDMKLLPEGIMSIGSLKIHTKSELITISTVGEKGADTFSYNGFTYKIHTVFDTKIGAYYKGIAIKVVS